MTSKIRIKFGPIEVEYEGAEDFLKEELPRLLEAVASLHKQSGATDEPIQAADGAGQNGARLQATTGAVAAKLNSKSGPDLAVAAAARLTFASGKETFTRKELLSEMKSASAYYKSSYGGNLSPYLNGLVKDGAFLEPAANTYSLSAAKKQELSKQLA